LGGSVRKYVGDYKGVTTYIKLVGLQGVTTNIIGRQGVTEGIGVMAGLLNGANADDPSQSASWNAIMVAVQNAYNTANGTGYGITMQWFSITSPASSVTNLTDALELLAQILQQAQTTNSVTASGQFQLDIQTGTFGPADPRPVFDWSLTITLDSNAHSITLMIVVSYDHMASNSIAEDILGVMVGTALAGGIIWDPGQGVGAGAAVGIAVGKTLTQAYNAAANSELLNALAGPLSKLTWVDQPINFSLSRPSSTQVILSVTYTFDSTTWNLLMSDINDPSSVANLAERLEVDL
jgi:hypothetical protein